MAVAIGLFVSTMNAQAFALLGPVQPWMLASNGVIYPGDIGGPMSITNGYRWNVPVVTYGFDKSFLDYFGTNGVEAVESAIKILNDLPLASQLALSNYPFNSLQANSSSQAQSLVDLKSQTLALLLEQLGLAQPTRNIYVLHDWDASFFAPQPHDSYIVIAGMPIFYESEGIDLAASGGLPGYVTNFVAGFNFDPATINPSFSLNNNNYAGWIYINLPVGHNSVEPFLIDPIATTCPAVADLVMAPGYFNTGLTYDDVGGLRYLLSTNNVNYETLLPGVQGVGANSESFVDGAWRPGVDKITFMIQPKGSMAGTFLPMTNQFTDTYITNGNAIQQQLQRVTTQPDFLFSAGFDLLRTGTTNWINNAALNNHANGAGPGIIQPPIVIAFQKTGSSYFSWSSYYSPVVWSEDAVQDISADTGKLGSFDGSTNAPIAFPAPQTGSVSMMVRMLLSRSNSPRDNFHSFEWLLTSEAGTVYGFQTSTNLSTWATLFPVTNNGSLCTYQSVSANSSSRFYRLTPQ